MTTKQIVQRMKNAKTGTISFNGLLTADEVQKARQTIIAHWEKEVAQYCEEHPDAEVNIIISDTQISIGGNQFQFLPVLPKSGKLVTRSKDYIIGDVYCAFADILPETYNETDKTFAFRTRPGNIVLIDKD